MKKDRLHNAWIILIIIINAFGCVEPFNPDISRYDDVLVVDGTFTDQSQSHFIRLSRTYGYYEFETRMETGAAILIIDDQGNSAAYSEIDDGLYELDPALFTGVPDRSYKIIIETQSGKRYESSYERLKSSVEIDSVYYEIEQDLVTLAGERYDGLQFYLNSEDANDQTIYYRWDWIETWEFSIPYIKPGFVNKVTCWNSQNSTNITIANTSNLEKDINHKQKLNFTSSRTVKLSKTYSLLVRQYSLTTEAYNFWRKLELSNEHTGSLFDPPPTPVTGNVYNTEDPFEPVLGYFQVSGMSEKRIFVQRTDLPANVDLTTGNEHCSSLEVMGEGIEELQDGWYLLTRYTWMDTIWTSMSSHIDCYDCTQKGSNVKPDYWIDNE